MITMTMVVHGSVDDDNDIEKLMMMTMYWPT